MDSYRREFEVSIGSWARDSGVNAGNLRRLLTGEHPATWAVLAKLLVGLGCESMQQLRERKEEVRPDRGRSAVQRQGDPRHFLDYVALTLLPKDRRATRQLIELAYEGEYNHGRMSRDGKIRDPYARRHVVDTGIRLMTGPEPYIDERAPISLRVSGSAQSFSRDILTLLGVCPVCGVRISRIDVAWQIKRPIGEILPVHVRKRSYLTIRRSARTVAGADLVRLAKEPRAGGPIRSLVATEYAGGLTTASFICTYDKALEQEWSPEQGPLTRIEARLRPRCAPSELLDRVENPFHGLLLLDSLSSQDLPSEFIERELLRRRIGTAKFLEQVGRPALKEHIAQWTRWGDWTQTTHPAVLFQRQWPELVRDCLTFLGLEGAVCTCGRARSQDPCGTAPPQPIAVPALAASVAPDLGVPDSETRFGPAPAPTAPEQLADLAPPARAGSRGVQRAMARPRLRPGRAVTAAKEVAS
ncbi:MAG: hypothetical protein RBU45_08810 [Myxococcota bacterium]|jgi:hypothetical protein|nr:hypothetical protein [Myxococcota bacterium]